MITSFLQSLGELLRQDLAADARLHPELAELPVLVAFHDPAPEGDHIALAVTNTEPLIDGERIYRLEAELSLVVHATGREVGEAKELLEAASRAALHTLCYGWHERWLPQVGCHVYDLTPSPEPLSTQDDAYVWRVSFTATLQFFAPPRVG